MKPSKSKSILCCENSFDIFLGVALLFHNDTLLKLTNLYLFSV